MDLFITLGSFVPLMVCLCWLFIFILNHKKNDPPKRILTVFLAVCSVLYFCHGIYFNLDLPNWMEAMWAACSLSVFPLYCIYICSLTGNTMGRRQMMFVLLPGIMVALAKLIFPGDVSDTARKMLFAVQVIWVCFYGFKKLQAFDKELANVYADTEGRDTTAVKHLLVFFILTSMLSTTVNIIGKHYFALHSWMMLIVMIPFAVLLFMLSYTGFVRNFSIEQYAEDKNDTMDETEMENSVETLDSLNELAQRIDALMTNEQFYLQKNLKIGDVAKCLGVCRTYISNCINKTNGCSFSDYVNFLRIEYAKQQLKESSEQKMIVIAENAGFSSEQSFYRNFKKFTGMTPTKWMEKK